MGRRNVKLEELNRLTAKTLDAKFLRIIQEGLNCSPFESEAVLEAVKEVYFPYLDEAAPQAPPGKITLVVVNADEPAGKPITKCEKQTVSLTIHRGAIDDTCLQKEGVAKFRQARISDICQEALSQGGLLTREDLAYRVFFVSVRTITRDLKELRESSPEIPLPLRGTVQDMGPVLSHRVEIVRLALRGYTTSEICQKMHHSPSAVSNYLSTFTRCAQLAEQGLSRSQIAYLLRRGESLVQQYLELVEESKQDEKLAHQLQSFLQVGIAGREKKREGRGSRP